MEELNQLSIIIYISAQYLPVWKKIRFQNLSLANKMFNGSENDDYLQLPAEELSAPEAVATILV